MKVVLFVSRAIDIRKYKDLVKSIHKFICIQTSIKEKHTEIKDEEKEKIQVIISPRFGLSLTKINEKISSVDNQMKKQCSLPFHKSQNSP